MLSDQLPSIDALANRFNTFLDSLTANFTPLVVQPRDSFFMVPEHFLVDNFTVYKSLRLVKPLKSSGPHPIPGTVWEEFAFERSFIAMDIYNAAIIHGCVPEPFKRSDVVQVAKCPPPESVKQDLRPISLTSQFAKIMEGFTLSAVLNQFSDNLSMFPNLLLRRNRLPMLFPIFFMPSFSPLTMAMCLHVYSLLISAKVSIWWTIAFWSKSCSF